MPDSANSDSLGPQQALPGKGLLGWLGRQVGYVTKAVKHQPDGPTTVFRASTIKERLLPENPEVKLRRTTIDEVIVKGNLKPQIRNPKQ